MKKYQNVDINQGWIIFENGTIVPIVDFNLKKYQELQLQGLVN